MSATSPPMRFLWRRAYRRVRQLGPAMCLPEHAGELAWRAALALDARMGAEALEALPLLDRLAVRALGRRDEAALAQIRALRRSARPAPPADAPCSLGGPA